MGIFQTIKRAFSGERAKPSRSAIRARYDAAQTTDDNRRHWAMADNLSSVGANSPEVRRTLRTRSRYEIANNSYARGITNTLAAYMIGAGPSLQLAYQGDDDTPPERLRELRQAAQQVEMLWSTWATERKLQPKLLTATQALVGDGESFALITSGRVSMKTPVELDFRLYECDQFEDPLGEWFPADPQGAAGVRINQRDGQPEAYAMLSTHPGDASSVADLRATWIPAESIVHLFRQDRPGQLRGIPWTTPALPLFAQLRRFTLATITAAETAADFAAILSQTSPDYETEQILASAWERIEIERGAFLTAPDGATISQLKAEHPNSTYEEFVRAILREIARCLSVPAVIALGDASNYNYASGRLDLQNFQRQIATDRHALHECELLDRLWAAWLDEALLIDGFLPAAFVETADDWRHGWRWSEPEHVDRAKEANGQATELASNTTTLAREYARKGLDWEVEIRQRARELALLRELGIGLQPETNSNQNTSDDENDDREETESDEQESEEPSATAAGNPG